MTKDKELSLNVRHANRRFMLVGLIGVVLSCVPFYLSIVPPMTDVAPHVLVARIIAEFDNPTLQFSEHFTINWAVTPNSLFYLLLVPLQKAVGPFWDARIYLTGWVTAIWLAVWYLARVRGQRDPWIAAMASLPLAFCWYAYKGFLPFLMTLPLFAVAVAVWYNNWPPAIKVPTLWVLLIALFAFHIVGAAAAAAAICVGACTQVFLVNRERGQLGLASIAVLPVPVLTAAYLFGESAPTATVKHAGLFTSAVDVVKFTCATLDNSATALMLVWLSLLVATFIAGWRRIGNESPIVIGAATLVALAVLVPTSLGALWPAGPRLFPFAIILLLVCLPWETLPRRIVGTVGLALLVGLSTFTVRHTVSIDRELRDFLSAVKVVEPGGTILPIIVDRYSESMGVDPFWALINAYTVMRGGSHPYVLASPHVLTGASPLQYRRANDREFAFLYDPPHPGKDYKGVSKYYDYVLLWGNSLEIADVIEQEMNRVHVSGKATLFARRREARGPSGS